MNNTIIKKRGGDFEVLKEQIRVPCIYYYGAKTMTQDTMTVSGQEHLERLIKALTPSMHGPDLIRIPDDFEEPQTSEQYQKELLTRINNAANEIEKFRRCSKATYIKIRKSND